MKLKGSSNDKPRVGVSSCLLGHRVRYDGAEMSVPWVATELANRVELVPICPEVGAGMPVPRPPIQRMESDAGVLRLVLVQGDGDVETPLLAYCATVIRQLEVQPIHGYVFKARSPSCGITDTPHVGADGTVVRHESGVWAEILRLRWPALPAIDESGLQEETGRNEFLQRIYAYWRESLGER